ncbi:MAG: hypothetical protein JWR74_2002 [Polaromonas sp.]|nr:hypothetical protein [Polaromonas sp.]
MSQLTDNDISRVFQQSAGYGRDDFQSFARAIIAAHEAAWQPPKGFMLMPLEPTPEMIEAARWEDGEFTARVVYMEMLAAAPNQPRIKPPRRA